jgi:hypothetical protein
MASSSSSSNKPIKVDTAKSRNRCCGTGEMFVATGPGGVGLSHLAPAKLRYERTHLGGHN